MNPPVTLVSRPATSIHYAPRQLHGLVIAAVLAAPEAVHAAQLVAGRQALALNVVETALCLARGLVVGMVLLLLLLQELVQAALAALAEV